MNEASVYLLKQNNGTKEIFSNNFFLSTFESYHPLRENDPAWLVTILLECFLVSRCFQFCRILWQAINYLLLNHFHKDNCYSPQLYIIGKALPFSYFIVFFAFSIKSKRLMDVFGPLETFFLMKNLRIKVILFTRCHVST